MNGLELPDLTVKDLMSTPVVALDHGLSLFLADWLMRERHIRHLPVLDKERRVVGLVTHKTILAAEHSDQTTDLVLPVADIMNQNPLTIGQNERAASAARFMAENRIGCAVVVDDEMHAVGMITESDFVEVAARLLFRVPRIVVDDFMTTDVVTMADNQPVKIADELMRAGRFRHLPVVDEQRRLTGLVTHRDLLAVHLGPDDGHRSGDIAKRDVWSIHSGSSARNAARMLADHKFGCLPVVDNDGRLVGIITEADLLLLLVRLLTRAGAFGRTDLPTRFYMSSPVHCVGVDAPLEHARTQMSLRSISALGVVSDDNRLVGILTATDLVARAGQREDFVAADRMTRDVVTVDAKAPITEVAQALVDAKVHRVFAVEDDRLAGVVSASDLVYAVRDMRIHTPLEDFMSPLVMTITAGESIDSALRLIETAQLRALIVLEQGWPIGVLSQRRLLDRHSSAAVVEDVLSGRLLCMPRSMPAFRAAAQMAELGVEHLVCISRGQPCGVVTSFDMAGLVTQRTRQGD